ncbi:MAG: hypothetical protein IJY20_02495 [Clostridia bacterium]|nr:hypothetical protein [Clostridia bacterium]
MKNKHSRIFAFLAICCLCCLLFSVSAFAAPIDSVIGGLEEEVPGITEVTLSILSINSLEDANLFFSQYSVGLLLITALIAALVAFYGYRALHFSILLGGFLGGWSISSAIYAWIAGLGLLTSLEPIPVYVPYIIFAVFGGIAAFIAMRIIRFGIFLATTAATYFFLNSLPSLNTMIDQLITEDLDAKYMLARFVVALVVGSLALIMTRPVIIITTGLAGGMITAIALMVAVEQTANVNLELVIGLIIATIGIIVQFTTRRRRRRSRRH